MLRSREGLTVRENKSEIRPGGPGLTQMGNGDSEEEEETSREPSQGSVTRRSQGMSRLWMRTPIHSWQGLAPGKPTCLAAIFEEPTRLPSASRTSIPSSSSPYRIRTTLQILALAGERGIQRRSVRHR